ncbi:hypothetical protein KSP40_PGU018669 [Platanthera guangdongensis]|uniref:Uncharacterized protein n=1 Tax=Platanthera guangdongensis TaxID=2320717 RepID=A0ABR2LQ98_9ASPA
MENSHSDLENGGVTSPEKFEGMATWVTTGSRPSSSPLWSASPASISPPATPTTRWTRRLVIAPSCSPPRTRRRLTGATIPPSPPNSTPFGPHRNISHQVLPPFLLRRCGITDAQLP